MRPFTMDDLDAIHRIWNDPGVRKYLWDDKPVSKEMAEATLVESAESFNRDGAGLWALMLREQSEMIGFCGLRVFADPLKVEVLYGLVPEHWGKGLATEAAKAMIRYGFEELGLNLIYAGADPPNQASFRVMEKSGMMLAERMWTGDLEAIYYVMARKHFQPDDSLYILWRAD